MFDPVTEDAFYAGIGSRETPEDICGMMSDIGRALFNRGYIMRSGGATGADRAFDMGTPGDAIVEIFLPWDGFNGQRDNMRLTPGELGNARQIAEKYHPNWPACSEGARKMHTRNVFQVLGRDLATPSRFVICWTKDGKASGGTGQALRIAQAYEIPIINLQRLDDRVKIYTAFGWENDG